MAQHSGKNIAKKNPLQRSRQGQLRVGALSVTDATSDRQIIEALQQLPSPLGSPIRRSLWNTDGCAESIDLKVRLLASLAEQVEPHELLQVLANSTAQGDWLKSYLLAGELYRLEMQSEEKLDVQTRAFVRAISLTAYGRLQGMPQSEGVVVEQREYAISSRQALGVHNLQDSLALFVWDRENKRLGVAHLDHSTQVESLGALLDLFGAGSLTGVLIGSRLPADSSDNILHTRAGQQLRKVLAYLRYKDIRISHAEIGKSVSLKATAAIGDPASGEFRRAFPEKESKYGELNTVLCREEMSGTQDRPLRKSVLLRDARELSRAEKIFSKYILSERELYHELRSGLIENEGLRSAYLPALVETYMRAHRQYLALIS